MRIHAERIRLSQALSTVAQEGHFKLSYNAGFINGDSIVSIAVDGTVEAALRGLVGTRFELKETGEHIILLGGNGKRNKFAVTGSVFDAISGGPVVNAYVHVVDEKSMTTTDALGTFRLDASGERERTAVLIMRKEYHDTVVYVGRDGTLGRVPLLKRSTVDQVEPICLYERCGVEDLGVARLLVPDQQLDGVSSLSIEERSPWQVSLIPNFGTNGKISGVVINSFSLNILVGYARGLEGLEIGGVANLGEPGCEGRSDRRSHEPRRKEHGRCTTRRWYQPHDALFEWRADRRAGQYGVGYVGGRADRRWCQCGERRLARNQSEAVRTWRRRMWTARRSLAGPMSHPEMFTRRRSPVE